MADLLTATEMAERLRIRPSTIQLWARNGFIPALRITGKVVRFDPVEVERALRKQAERRKRG